MEDDLKHEKAARLALEEELKSEKAARVQDGANKDKKITLAEVLIVGCSTRRRFTMPPFGEGFLADAQNLEDYSMTARTPHMPLAVPTLGEVIYSLHDVAYIIVDVQYMSLFVLYRDPLMMREYIGSVARQLPLHKCRPWIPTWKRVLLLPS